MVELAIVVTLILGGSSMSMETNDPPELPLLPPECDPDDPEPCCPVNDLMKYFDENDVLACFFEPALRGDAR